MTTQKDVGRHPGVRLGKALGLFSIGLGLTELIAPRPLARFIGIDDRGKAPSTMRLFGLREIGAGALLLAMPASPLGGWNRLLGDVMDLAGLGLAMRRCSNKTRNIGAIAAVLGVAVFDAMHGVREQRRKFGEPVRQAITVGRSRDEVYAFWRKLENLPQFMNWLETVEERDDKTSHWVVKTIAGATLEYDAEITSDIAGREIKWRSLPNATVPVRGKVEFLDAPGDRGTEIVIEMQVAAPLGKTIASKEVAGDLHRLKQILELGEIVQSDASIHKGKHPAQPSAKGGMS